MHVPPELDRLVAALHADAPPDTRPHVRASSVLAPIIQRPDGLHFLLTRRTTTLSSFSGDLSFPGGRMDPTDAGPRAAALRETHEEIGIPPSQVHVLGFFTELATHLGGRVYCYVGLLAPHDVPANAASKAEVDELLHVPIASLLDPGRIPPRPHAYVATAYESRLIGSPVAPGRTLHYWTLETDPPAPRTVLWGFTAETIAQLLRAGYGWTPPSVPRTVHDVGALRP